MLQSPGRQFAFFAVILLLLGGCESRRDLPTVTADFETEPVPSSDDAADDPAIWRHPTNPPASLILGTNKRAGLHSYDLSGRERQHLAVGRLNNVDLRQGVLWDGARKDIAAATNRTDQSVTLFEIGSNGEIAEIMGSRVQTGLTEPYGLCLHYTDKDVLQLFVNDKDGRYQQWRLTPSGRVVSAELLREFRLQSQPEGCVAEDKRDVIYLGEENVGVWRADADAAVPFDPVQVDSVTGPNLTADVEGVALYRQGGRKWLIVSSQGDDSFAVYNTADNDRFLGSFRIADGGIDGVSETDGIDVTAALTPDYPLGLLVVQDGDNQPAAQNQNFKIVSMARVIELLGQDN